MRPEITVLTGIAGFALITMLAYRVSPAGRQGGDLTGRGGSFVLGFWVRNWFYWLIGPVTRASVGLGLTPLFYNMFAVACGLGSMLGYATGHLPLAGALIFVSGIADVLDGEIARGTGTADARGAFLDSTLDRFTEFVAFAGLAYFFESAWGAFAVVVALGGSLLVSYTRARGESLGVLCKVGMMQRAERMILLGLGSILDPSLSAALGRPTGTIVEAVVILIAAGTVITSVHRTVWIARALHDR
jgi:phosphatidylinositol phosphate synthase